MSEIMRPMPFGRLMNWAMQEYAQQKRIFGVHEEKFYKNASGGKSYVPMTQTIENFKKAIREFFADNSQPKD